MLIKQSKRKPIEILLPESGLGSVPKFEEAFDLQLRRDIKVVLPISIGYHGIHTVVVANEGTKVRAILKLLRLS